MAAVVRVKRALDEEPSGALILSCKRRKKDAENEAAVDTLFKFAGTVKDQEDNVALLDPEKLIKADVKTASRPVPDSVGKARAQAKASSQGNRYKLVNYFRTLGSKDEADPEKDSNQNSITVLDVESQLHSKNDGKEPRTSEVDGDKPKDPQYVYDLYYIESDSKDIDVDDLMLDGLVSFAPVEHELVFDSYRNNRAEGGNSDSDSPLMDDDDDSNDENNWRNDYPDDEEEGGNSDGDGGLASRLGRVTFGDHELSSDSDDERLIYGEDLSPSDVRMYGAAYAKFKKKALKELDSSTEINSNSDEENSRSDIDSDGND